MGIVYFFIILATILQYSLSLQPSQIKIISRGELYSSNSQSTPTVTIDNLTAFQLSSFSIPLSNFKATFTGWIQTGSTATINKFQSKIQIYNSAKFDEKLLFFGNNSTHFILKQDLSLSTSSCICTLLHQFNTNYKFVISIQQDSSGLQVSLTLRLSDGTILTCKNSEPNPSNILAINGKSLNLVVQVQRPSDINYIQSTQKMGGITLIQNYFYTRNSGQTNLDEERFLVQFNPVGLQLFYFKFSHEQSDCNCLIDSSENQIQGKLTSQFGVIEAIGAGGYFIYSFTQNQAVNFSKSNIRFGQPMNSFYNSLNIKSQSNSNAFESVLLSFWVQVDQNTQEFQVLSYQSTQDQLFVKIKKNTSTFQLIFSYSGTDYIINSSLNFGQFYHIIIQINFSFVDLYLNGFYNSRVQVNMAALFSTEQQTGSINIGGKNIPATSKVAISQIRMFSSSSILTFSSTTDQLVANCLTLVQERGNYTCLLCKDGFYLNNQGQCTSSCNSTSESSLQNVKQCVSKCSYKCKTCSPTDPFKCASCDTGRQLKGTTCFCINDTFEDYKSYNCYSVKKLTKGYEIGQITFKSQASLTVQFKNAFSTVPKVLFSVIGLSVSDSYIGPFEVTGTSITKTQMVVNSGISAASSYLHVQFFAYESNNKQFYSSSFGGSGLLTGPGTFTVTDFGSYYNSGDNFNLHVFLAGYQCNPLILFLGIPTSCNLDLQVQSNNRQILYENNVGVLSKYPTFYYLLTPPEIKSTVQNINYGATSIFQNTNIQEKFNSLKMPLTPLSSLSLGLNPLSLDVMYSFNSYVITQTNFQNFKLQPNELGISQTGWVEQNWELLYNTQKISTSNIQATVLFEKYDDSTCGVKDYYTLKCIQCKSFGYDPTTGCTTTCLPTFIKDSNGNCVCGSGKYFDSITFTCLACNPSCSECMYGDSCSSCKGTLVLQQSGLCSCAVPHSWFDSSGICSPCKSTCNTCNNSSSCLDCKQGLTLNSSTLQCECLPEYWFNTSTDQCEKCYITCSSCTSTNYCSSCKGGRNLSSGQCKCISNDPRIFPDDLRCSQDIYAVLDPNLSADFSSLSIDFGVNIQSIQSFQNPSNPSYEICSKIFDSQTLTILGNGAKCKVNQQNIEVTLDGTGRVLSGDNLIISQNAIKFSYNNKVITTFYRNIVLQTQQLPQSEIMLKYNMTQNYCQKNTISIDKIINDGKRGIKQVEWVLLSIKPQDQKATQKLVDTINQANTDQSQSLEIFVPMTSSDLDIQVQLKWKVWINQNGIETINIIVQKKKTLRIGHTFSSPAPFFVYKDIEIIHSISCEICDENGRVYRIPEPLTVSIKNSKLGIDNNQFSYTKNEIKTIIKAFSMISQNQYPINSIFTVESDTSVTVNDSVDLYISPSDLVVKILGGSRYASYKNKFSIQGFFKDFETQNQDPNAPNGIQISWRCVNIATNSTCHDIKDKIISLQQGVEKQIVEKYTFQPYSVVQIEVQGLKQRIEGQTTFIRTGLDKVIIFITELDIPPLEVILPQELIVDPTINPNQMIHAVMEYDPTINIDQLFYSGAILYQNEVVGVIKFDYKKIRFQVWNYFNGFSQDDVDIQVRFSVYNPQYVLPSLSTISFKLNFPPKNCKLQINKESIEMYSLTSPFEIKMVDCEDDNQPIQYQFFYYSLSTEIDFEIKNPLLLQRKQITDVLDKNIISTNLPAGKIQILAQAIDIHGAISNSTVSIDIKVKQYNPTDYIKFVNQYISTIQNLSPEQYIFNLNLLAEDIIYREASLISVESQILQQKLQIVDNLEFACNQILSSSYFYQLAIQSISSLFSSNIQMSQSNQSTQIQLIKSTLIDIKGRCVASDVSQKKYEKCMEDLYLVFNWLDSLSIITQATDPSLNKQFITLTEQIGNMLNLYAIPNENQMLFKGTNFQIKSQKITEKNLEFFTGLFDKQQNKNRILKDITHQTEILNRVIEQNNSPNTEQTKIYDASYKIYDINLYSDEESFKNYTNVYLNLTQKYALNFPIVNPSIVDTLTNEQYPPQYGIVHYFDQKNGTQNLTCFAQSKQKQWTQSECSTRKNEKTQEIQCICPELSSTTIIEDISSLFTDNKNIDTIFSESGLENLASFSNFYLYLVFWVLLGQTILFIFLSIYGMRLDSKYLYESIPIALRKRQGSDQIHLKEQRKRLDSELINVKQQRTILDSEQRTVLDSDQRTVSDNEQRIALDSDQRTRLDSEQRIRFDSEQIDQKEEKTRQNSESNIELNPRRKSISKIFPSKNTWISSQSDQNNSSTQISETKRISNKLTIKTTSTPLIPAPSYLTGSPITQHDNFIITEEDELKHEESPIKPKRAYPLICQMAEANQMDTIIANSDKNTSTPKSSQNQRRKTYSISRKFSQSKEKNFLKQTSIVLEDTIKQVQTIPLQTFTYAASLSEKDSSDSESNIFNHKPMQLKASALLKMQYKDSDSPQHASSPNPEKMTKIGSSSTLGDHQSVETDSVNEKYDTPDKKSEFDSSPDNKDSDNEKQIDSNENTNKNMIRNNNNKNNNSRNIQARNTQGRNARKFERGNKKTKVFRYVQHISDQEIEKLTEMSKINYYVYFHEFISIFLVFKYEISRVVRFIMFYIRYEHTLAISILFGQNKSTIQTVFLSLASSISILLVSLVIEGLLTQKNFLSKIGALISIFLSALYIYVMLSIVSGQAPNESNKFIYYYVQYLITDIVFIQTLTALLFGFFAKRIVSKPRKEDEFLYKLFNLLKLNVIINTLLK